MFENPSDRERAETERICALRERLDAERRGEEYHPDDYFDPSRDDHWHR